MKWTTWKNEIRRMPIALFRSSGTNFASTRTVWLCPRVTHPNPHLPTPLRLRRSEKVAAPRVRNKRGAKPGHTGHRRQLSELQPSDNVVACTPASCCCECGGEVVANASPTFRHQVFELPVLPLDITEYQVFHGHCQHCDAVSKGSYPKRHLVVRWGHV